MTMSGIVTIKRSILCKKEKPNGEAKRKEIVPLDELLGIEGLPFKMTKSVMLEVAYVGQMMHSYREASEEIYRRLGYQISASLVRAVTIYVGNLVYENDTKKSEETQKDIVNSAPAPEERLKGILYILTDGSNLNTRTEGKDGSSWRENKIGMCYSSANVLKRGSKEKNGHTITKKEYTAFVGSAEEFQKYIYQIAINQGYGRYDTTIVLGDGAAWIRTMCDDIFPDAIQILDYYHLEENIYDFAKSIFGNDESKYKPWASMIIQYIMDNNIYKALSEIYRYSDHKLPAGTVNLKTYINNNIDKINYEEYKSNKWMIGSGAIESANKVILQRRLKQAGMRWNVKTAQPLLSLRAKVESGLFASEIVPLLLNCPLSPQK
jgi:hypothetical protein